MLGWGSLGVESWACVMSMWCRMGCCWLISGFEVVGGKVVAGRWDGFSWGGWLGVSCEHVDKRGY